MKLLINKAADFFQEKGDTAITKNLLYTGCRSGKIPHFRVGNRYIVDTEELEKFFKTETEKSVHQEEAQAASIFEYGKLRKVKA